MHDFYEAKGQYDVYRKGLQREQIEHRLYLAIEESVFNSFFQKSLIKEIVEEDKISLIIYSVPNKEIVSWHQH